ncbi:hypothetical protein ABZO31_01265 [Streptomyces sp. HUAS MG47]|uniref:hypothetical protein n=1 Tax=Streptomyces solicamelliae TaxID=3231716 RepID=UPI0038780876
MRGGAERIRRGAAACLMGGIVLLSASACSPELRPIVAVSVDERGTPRALLRSCDDGWVRSPRLRGEPTPPSAAPSSPVGTPAPSAPPSAPAWVGWNTDEDHRAADFPLFTPPVEWKADFRGTPSLRPGYTYALRFWEPDDALAYAGEVTFDAEDLARLEPGQVLTFQGVMTRDAFEEAAEDAC